MPIQKNDFVEIDYVGKIKDDNTVFDVTSAESAKKHNLYSPQGHYHSRVICVGQKQIIRGIDEGLVGKEPGKSYVLAVKPQDAFGMKDPKMMKVVSIDVLRKQNIDPFPGLQLNASGMMATVKSVSGGRVMLDFNHPLAGRELVYELDVHDIVQDDKKKVFSLLENFLHIHEDQVEMAQEGKQLTVKTKQALPKEVQELLGIKVKELLPGVDLKFA